MRLAGIEERERKKGGIDPIKNSKESG